VNYTTLIPKSVNLPPKLFLLTSNRAYAILYEFGIRRSLACSLLAS